MSEWDLRSGRAPAQLVLAIIAIAACGRTSSNAALEPTTTRSTSAGGSSNAGTSATSGGVTSSSSGAGGGASSTAAGGAGAGGGASSGGSGASSGGSGGTGGASTGGTGSDTDGTTTGEDGGAAGAAGAANPWPPPPSCLGLDAYWLTAQYEPSYALYFVETEAGCHAILAPENSEPEVYDLRFVDSTVELRPRSYATYYERTRLKGTISTIVDRITVDLDAAGLPLQATLSGHQFAHDWELNFHVEQRELYAVEALSLAPVLEVPTVAYYRSDRPYFPWESLELLVSPPLVDFDALSTPDGYGPWQPQNLGPPQDSSYDLDEYDYRGDLRSPVVLSHSGVTAPCLAWAPGSREVLLELGPTQDVAGRSLQSASISVPFVELPGPLSAHEFDGEQTFAVFGHTKRPLFSPPPECETNGCLHVESPEEGHAEAAGIVDTSGATTVRVQAYGYGRVRIVRPNGEVLPHVSISEPPMPLVIPTEDPYVGVYFEGDVEGLYIDRVWAE